MNGNSTIRRILVVDDTPSIHEDFKKVLCPSRHGADVDDLERELFGEAARTQQVQFEIDTVFQGEDALKCVKDSIASGRPYALAFVDMRMPPGWDGMRTIEELHKVDPALPLVTCTAYSDYTPEQVVERVGLQDGYLYIRKPFDSNDVRKIAEQMSSRSTSPAL